MFKNKIQIALGLLFLAFVGWWISFQPVVEAQGMSVQWFSGTYGVLALIGAVIGFVAAKKWGGFKTVLGKALTFFSLGLLAQEAGQLIYQYYIYVSKVEIPYPSWGDAAYFGSVLLYICATIFLMKAVGIKYSLKSNSYKIIAIFIPLILLLVSYFIFLYHHEYDTSQPLTVLLDFGYPMGQAVYISLAITAYLLSRKMLGGIMKAGIILVIAALFVQYVADFTFIYQTSRETFVVGKFDDLFYLIAYFMMATVMIKFLSTYQELNSRTSKQNTTKTGVE